MRRSVFVVCVSLGLLGAGHRVVTQAPSSVHVWVKAFIPKVHPTNPGYVQLVPGMTNRWMIPGPGGLGCFYTDHRGFSTDRSASARVTTEFVLVVTGNSATVSPVPPNASIHLPNSSTNVNCQTGAVMATKQGTLRTNAVGTPAVGGTQAQVIMDVSAVNPFAPPVVSPSIDYSLDTIYDTATKKLTISFSRGKFPSFEGYAQVNNGPIVTIFREDPTTSSAWGLYDFGLGLPLPQPIDGGPKIPNLKKTVTLP